MKRINPTIFILLTLTALLAPAGCGQERVTLRDGKLLMVGNENIAFLQVADGNPTGFSAELATETAERLGLKLEVITRGDHYGIAVKKGNSKLLARINEALEKIKKDGTYDRLYKKYFGKKI